MNLLAQDGDPIVAIATAPGRGAVGIVRASGKSLGALAQAISGRALVPRHATYLPFGDGQGGVIDQGLALYFPAPHSYTGEDVLELQIHGGPVVLQLLLARLLELGASSRLRVAQPGEFTRRAFLNGKLDLAQAESVADLIDASTEAAARSATRALAGELSRAVGQLAAELVELRLLVEATLDFPEEDIDFLRQAQAQQRLQTLERALQQVQARTRQGALLREGLRVVLAGQPNVGKSSLLNALAGAELAIVTPIAGTTRDKVSQTIQIEGVPLHIVDTAGLRDSADVVERIGVERSWHAIADADVVLFLHDLSRLHAPGYAQAEADIARGLPRGAPVLHVFNKRDRVDADALALQLPRVWADWGLEAGEAVWISAASGEGLQTLRHKLLTLAGAQQGSEGVFIARQRHVQALAQTRQHLDAAVRLIELDAQAPLDLLAEELRLAHQALMTITGEYTPDDLLGAIFSSFCIGK
ncbi:tRNA uridine-5-carboxymethylaminomethyl(34) synthesis GTPase MnmE [Thiomonas intermedia]|uniref:tRNA uridine-5-carboxymethylaminomethyl(34) synthesis GTPase MnmE n=1 Tax=Thiomonas intermedia TaxID=926 RepID=UPI0009A4FA8C|nr:tRNA uridine-5-carboxymethylaminomethyl(34) synthesis GTPase MnmE [Thiomonas intermedia]